MLNKSVSNICKIAALLCIVQSAIAGVVDNSVYTERARIHSGNELVSTILNNCLDMNCLKSNVLNYLNTYLGIDEQSGRSLESVDEQIFERVGKVLKTQEFHFQLPETFFHKSEISFNAERGFDVKVSEEAVNEGNCYDFIFPSFLANILIDWFRARLTNLNLIRIGFWNV